MTNLTNSFYSHIVTDIPNPYIKYLIGKKGCHLKKCCTKSGVSQIWFNPKKHCIEMWGTRDKLYIAQQILMTQINKIRERVPKEEILDVSTRSVDICVSGSLDNALPREKINLLIGKNGYFFKRITSETNTSFIWYNQETNNVDFYGTPENIQLAIQKVFDRIHVIQECKSDEIKNDVNSNNAIVTEDSNDKVVIDIHEEDSEDMKID